MTPTELADQRLQQPSPVVAASETAGFSAVLLSDAAIPAGAECRLRPGLDVSRWDRIHVSVGDGARSVPGLHVRVLFDTPLPGTRCGGLLTGSTIWYEAGSDPVTFEYTTPPTFGATGFTMSVPVIAPVLYDVVLRNTGPSDLDDVSVALFARET